MKCLSAASVRSLEDALNGSTYEQFVSLFDLRGQKKKEWYVRYVWLSFYRNLVDTRQYQLADQFVKNILVRAKTENWKFDSQDVLKKIEDCVESTADPKLKGELKQFLAQLTSCPPSSPL